MIFLLNIFEDEESYEDLESMTIISKKIYKVNLYSS